MESTVEMWLWLLLVMQPHNPRTQKILSASGYDIRRACIQVRNGFFPFLTDKEKKRAQDVRMKEIRDLQRLCCENDIYIVPIDSPDYPEKLRLIDNPPIVLFARGNLRCLKNRLVVSAVGTRKPSDYGISVSQYLAEGLASEGAAVVSGLAVGLDTAAHRGALNVKGVTVGVLACGCLYNYPVESKELKEEIVRSGGAIISELMPQSDCPRGYFPMRNRLIAGIADATLVLEAPSKSGTLLTANHAFEMKRRVFVVSPHSISDPQYAGLIDLYRSGATLVFGAEDILNAFMLTRTDKDVSTKLSTHSYNIPFLTNDADKQTMESSARVPAATAAPAAAYSAAASAVPAATPAPVSETIPAAPLNSESSAASKAKRSTSKTASSASKTAAKSATSKLKKQFKPFPREMPGKDFVILRDLTEKDLTMEDIAVRYPHLSFPDIAESFTNLEIGGYIAKNPNGTYSRI
ncbi:MAG: DNA-processing protein DprA [Oscillospiraceae bacterium]